METELGRRLMAIRKRIEMTGTPLLDWDGLEKELKGDTMISAKQTIEFGVTASNIAGAAGNLTLACPAKYTFTPQPDMTPVEAVYIAWSVDELRHNMVSLDRSLNWDKIARHFTKAAE